MKQKNILSEYIKGKYEGAHIFLESPISHQNYWLNYMNVEIENIPRMLHIDTCSFSTKTWVKEPAKLILASNSKQIVAKKQTKDHRIHKFSILMHYIFIVQNIPIHSELKKMDFLMTISN